MWIYPNYEEPHTATLAHLRGQSPLDAGRLVLQGSNVGNERLVKMNENQGAAGLAYRTDAHDNPTVQQAQATRDQFNNAVNSKDMAGAIAIMAGQWGYLQFGLDAQKLQLLEQGDKAFEKLCNVLSTPPSIFKTDQTYENQRESKRNWVYDNIAPAAYSFRDELNEKLILQMGLDRDRDFIDCDILGLPEMAIDMKAQIETYSKAWWFTPNQILKKLGEDESSDPNMNKVYAPSSVVPLDELNVQIGSNLDSEMNLLNDQSAQA
jgi:phage portal protein BeeE